MFKSTTDAVLLHEYGFFKILFYESIRTYLASFNFDFLLPAFFGTKAHGGSARCDADLSTTNRVNDLKFRTATK